MLSSFKLFLLLDCLLPSLLQYLGSTARDDYCVAVLSPSARGDTPVTHLSVTSTMGLQVVDLAAAKLDLLTTTEEPTAILERNIPLSHLVEGFEAFSGNLSCMCVGRF